MNLTTAHKQNFFCIAGGAWTRKAQVDLVGINSMEKTLILGECKWSPKEIDRDVLETLAQKTGEFVPREGRWRVYYYGFARGGWSSAARAFATDFRGENTEDGNWQVVGMSLLYLCQVDQDLRDWSQGKDEDV